MTFTSRIFDVAKTALDLLVADWPVDGSVPALPKRQYVNWGAVIWDCEQLVVSIERTFGIAGDVTQEGFFNDYGLVSLRAVTLAVWHVRCMPDIDSAGNEIVIPKPADIEAASLAIAAASDVVVPILSVAQREHRFVGCESLAFENMTATGQEGGFGGSVTRVRCGLV